MDTNRFISRYDPLALPGNAARLVAQSRVRQSLNYATLLKPGRE